MRDDRPTYTKWKRKTGGMKVCRKCGHRHKPVIRIEGRIQRPKACVKCGTLLPSKLTYPKKGYVQWYVRQFDTVTGQTNDFACDSSEAANELIRRLQRDFTRDPIQEWLIEHISNLIRGIEAADRDAAINTLIEKLGGDAITRKLKPIGWDEAVEIIADEMHQKGQSDVYIDELRRVASDLCNITGLTEWAKVDLDAIAKYRSVRMAGDWKRNGRYVGPVRGRAINKDLATLSAFLTRTVRKGWVARNILENQPDERVKVKTVRVEYMPDEDLKALIEAADTPWLRAFVIVAYYTGARRADLLRLEWDTDSDLDGDKAAPEGRVGPHIYIQGNKADTPHWMPLHPAAVQALQVLRHEPVIGPRVFPVRGKSAGPKVSHIFADLCIRAGLTEQAERNGAMEAKNRWSLHDLRRKANTDLRNRGASPKERAALLGHRTTAVNESHYEAVIPSRERELIDGLPVFEMIA